MILTTHALVGAAIGKNFNNPLVIIPTALAAHFILDSFAHGEYLDKDKETIREISLKVTTDLIIGFSIILFLISLDFATLNLPNIFLGTFFGMFPDLLTLIYWKFPRNKILVKIKDLHEFAHRHNSRYWTLKNARNDVIASILAIIFFLL
jgi:hypothetical protein